MTTTQLCTPGKPSSLDKSYPAMKDIASTATHTDGWSILHDSVRGGVATDFVDFSFRLSVAGKCKPISLRRLREEWPDRDKKQWIKRVVHDVFNLFFAMSNLAKPLKADRNISNTRVWIVSLSGRPPLVGRHVSCESGKKTKYRSTREVRVGGTRGKRVP